MGFATWAKQAQKLASQHSDKITSGIDTAASTAKKKAPTKGSYIDRAADAAKKAMGPK